MKLVPVIVLLSCSLVAHSQHKNPDGSASASPFLNSAMSGVHLFPDSVRIEFQDPAALLVIKCKSVAQTSEKVEVFFKTFADLVQQVEKSIPDVSKSYQVEVKDLSSGKRNAVIALPVGESTRMSITEKEITQLLPPGWEFHIHSKDAEIYVYAQTYAQIKELAGYKPEPVIQLIRTANATNGIGRKRMVGRIIINKETVIFHDIKFEMPEDFLVGTVSSGLGYLAGTFYPELNGVISIRRGDHFNRANTKITLTYNNMFFMEPRLDGGYTPRINSFLNLGWSKNADGSGQFIGLGAGYLIHSSGSYFKGHTAKFFITKDVGHFTIVPEFYLTNGFNDFQMGIKVNFTF